MAQANSPMNRTPARARRPACALAIALALSGLAAIAAGGAHAAAAEASSTDDLDEGPAVAATIGGSVRVLRDQAYGPDPRQRFDVYAPPGLDPAHPVAPLLFVVHGGGWRTGDRTARSVVEHKVAHWVAQGWVVVSIDYRLLPAAPVATQIEDVAHALAAVQARAASWGADARRTVLVGHSAGAHLVAWLAAGGPPPPDATLQPWRGAVLLDSAVYDVAALMRFPHLPLYDAAFGRDAAAWGPLSPAMQLARPMPPMLAVCSTRRRLSCPMADRFVERAVATGTRAAVLREDLSHLQINAELGVESDYTAQVDRFVASLAPSSAPGTAPGTATGTARGAAPVTTP
jgi:acetyl esterase/lipase